MTFINYDDADEIAIERAVAGDGISLRQLTRVEQLEAVRQLTERGESLSKIARRLATSTATVSRRRAALHEARVNCRASSRPR